MCTLDDQINYGGCEIHLLNNRKIEDERNLCANLKIFCYQLLSE